MLLLAEQFNVSTSAEFRAGEKLSNGARTLTLVESATASGGGASNIEIPAQVWFKMALTMDSTPVDIECRFRYQLRDAHLQLRLDFFGLDELNMNLFRWYADRIVEDLPTARQVVGPVPRARSES
jgi:hypothetical protein